MDSMKRETVIDYTSWDLNAKCVQVKNRQKLEAKLKRKARRKNKKFLKKVLTGLKSYDIIKSSKERKNKNDL